MALPTLRNEVVEQTINGTVYKIELLGAKKGQQIAMTLLRVIGPAFEAKDHAISKFLELATDSQLDMLVNTFAGQTRISPADQPEVELSLKDTFDKHFVKKYGTMMLWLKACLEANYGDFLGELGVDSLTLKEAFALAMKPDQTNPTMDPTPPSGAASLRATES